MTALSIHDISRSFGSLRALAGVSFDVEAGSTVALLGPSGCGKTTLLRIIAGFDRPDDGAVTIDDEVVSGQGRWVPPERRSIGYVAQEGALFPHLTVEGNIQFALTRAERREGARVAELLALVSLDGGQRTRHPHQLSGGQQQRVALARALARRPGLMLLDEPFAALDASLRAGTRELMAAALAAEKVTTVLVTHDQEEALSFADRVVVMRDGRIRQAGTPREVYAQPADAWTAAFVGDAVLLPAHIKAGSARTALGVVPVTAHSPDLKGAGSVLLRPEQILLSPVTAAAPNDPERVVGTVVVGTVVSVSYRGHDSVVVIDIPARTKTAITCRVPGDAAWLTAGITVLVCVRGSAITVPNPH